VFELRREGLQMSFCPNRCLALSSSEVTAASAPRTAKPGAPAGAHHDER